MTTEAESTWIFVARLADVQRCPQRVMIGEQQVGVYWFNGQVYALDNECPHASAPLTDGYLNPDGHIECALHGWRYHLKTGLSPLAYQGCVRTFSLRILGENVELLLPQSH